MHARVVLGVGKVSCLERCPQLRSVLIEEFHCIIHPYCIYIHVAGVLSSGGVSL